MTTDAVEAAEVSPAQYPEDLRALVEDYLGSLRFSAGPATDGLEEAMRYSLLAGGKRIRPVLALASARAVGGEPEDVLPTAAAIELVHTYSLIHDDLPAMDDDDLRRGRPTCHIAYGENVAILAGDGLMAEAYRLVLDRQRGSAESVVAALRAISDAIGVGGIVGGQYIDVTGEPDLGADELGVLFQIIDDILDVTGSDADLGKPSGSDERHGKATYVSVFGLERARTLAAESHERAQAALRGAAPMLSGNASDLGLVMDFIRYRSS